VNQTFGPPQPAASTKALSAVESSSTPDPGGAAQNLASASASAASNDTDLITLGMPGLVPRRCCPVTWIYLHAILQGTGHHSEGQVGNHEPRGW
jgi:hypothetical protein